MRKSPRRIKTKCHKFYIRYLIFKFYLFFSFFSNVFIFTQVCVLYIAIHFAVKDGRRDDVGHGSIDVQSVQRRRRFHDGRFSIWRFIQFNSVAIRGNDPQRQQHGSKHQWHRVDDTGLWGRRVGPVRHRTVPLQPSGQRCRLFLSSGRLLRPHYLRNDRQFAGRLRRRMSAGHEDGPQRFRRQLGHFRLAPLSHHYAIDGECVIPFRVSTCMWCWTKHIK